MVDGKLGMLKIEDNMQGSQWSGGDRVGLAGTVESQV